jgi:hypothetical protein
VDVARVGRRSRSVRSRPDPPAAPDPGTERSRCSRQARDGAVGCLDRSLGSTVRVTRSTVVSTGSVRSFPSRVLSAGVGGVTRATTGLMSVSFGATRGTVAAPAACHGTEAFWWSVTASDVPRRAPAGPVGVFTRCPSPRSGGCSSPPSRRGGGPQQPATALLAAFVLGEPLVAKERHRPGGDARAAGYHTTRLPAGGAAVGLAAVGRVLPGRVGSDRPRTGTSGRLYTGRRSTN